MLFNIRFVLLMILFIEDINYFKLLKIKPTFLVCLLCLTFFIIILIFSLMNRLIVILMIHINCCLNLLTHYCYSMADLILDSLLYS